MKLSISPVSFTSNDNRRIVSQEKKDDIRDGAVVGGAAGAGYSAARNNVMKSIKDAESACKAGKAAAAAKVAKNSSGLFAGFKNNAKVLTQKLVTKLDNIKASKYIKPIINNRATRFACGIFGGILAGCVLISGIGTLYSNTTKIVEHYVPRYAEKANSYFDKYSSKE